MTDSFRLRLVMTCADNNCAVQHEKRACRVKCTLYTQGQEATKTNGTTLTESKGKNDLRTAWIYPKNENKKKQTKKNTKTTKKRKQQKMKNKKEKKKNRKKKADDSAQFPIVSLASFCLTR